MQVKSSHPVFVLPVVQQTALINHKKNLGSRNKFYIYPSSTLPLRTATPVSEKLSLKYQLIVYEKVFIPAFAIHYFLPHARTKNLHSF